MSHLARAREVFDIELAALKAVRAQLDKSFDRAVETIIAALKSRLPQPVSLHICGNAMPILGDMAASGADVLELDHQVDLATACGVLGPRIAIWGNLDPVGLLAHGTPEDVRRATTDLLLAARQCGHRRLVVSSGCTLAPDTPAENIEALLAVTRLFPARPH